MYHLKTELQHSILKRIRPLMACAAALVLSSLLPGTANAADTRAVTVSSSNNSLGAVFCTVNNASFEHYTYAEPGDYITVKALPVNKNYDFLHWTDNGVIVSESSTYSFSVKDENHVIMAHFDAKPEMKHKRYDAGKDISSIAHSTNACEFASGYKIHGMTINTALVPLDETSTAAVEAMTGGSFVGAFRIQFTFGYEGKETPSLDQATRLVLQLPASWAGTCHIVSLGDSSPVILDDLDSTEKTVTFETDQGGLYAVTISAPAAAPPTAPVAVPQPVPVIAAQPAPTN